MISHHQVSGWINVVPTSGQEHGIDGHCKGYQFLSCVASWIWERTSYKRTNPGSLGQTGSIAESASQDRENLLGELRH